MGRRIARKFQEIKITSCNIWIKLMENYHTCCLQKLCMFTKHQKIKKMIWMFRLVVKVLIKIHTPNWSLWIWYPALVCDPNFLFMKIVQNSGHGSSNWFPATNVGPCIGFCSTLWSWSSSIHFGQLGSKSPDRYSFCHSDSVFVSLNLSNKSIFYKVV